MNQLDALYRALAEYKKETAESKDCLSQRRLLASTDSELSKIETSRAICFVDETWVSEIEKGLVCVEKAIRSERQFIRSNGTIMPIEKVKRVSKDSVEHLSKHSNLIARQDENGNFIPDKLYTVERQSDYAVYENRFLYMLLCYLRDFVEIRYNRIIELSNTYLGSCTVSKTIAIGKQKMQFRMKLNEERQDDKYMRENNAMQKIVDRIDVILKATLRFLEAPLMQEVAKTPLLKPPIVKTNVLKMNQNFRGATALYEYLTSYDKLGFTVRKRTTRICPMPDKAADEFAEVVGLASFLTYEYGLGLTETLKSAYDAEQSRRRAEEERKSDERFEALRRRANKSGLEMEEYMLMLEDRNKLLEYDSAQLVRARQDIEKMKQEADGLTEMIQDLHADIEAKRDEFELLNNKHKEAIAAEKSAHEKKIGELSNQFSEEVAELNVEHGNAVLAISETHKVEIASRDLRISELEERLSEEREESRRLLADTESSYTTKLEDTRDHYREEAGRAETRLADSMRICERITAEKRLSDARLLAIKKEHNLFSANENFTTQASFSELEHQYKVFREFFKSEWKKTKKRIREETLKPPPPDFPLSSDIIGLDTIKTENEGSGKNSANASGLEANKPNKDKTDNQSPGKNSANASGLEANKPNKDKTDNEGSGKIGSDKDGLNKKGSNKNGVE